MTAENKTLTFDIQGIKSCQLNRFPVLLIDKVFDVVPGKFARGIKNFTYNEWFFQGHFEDEPNVPGFIQLECLVQTFLMTFLCLDEYKHNATVSSSITNVQFKRKIIPGDRLEIIANLDSIKRGVAKGSVESHVEGEAACRADFIIVVPAVLDKFKPHRAV